MVELEYKRRLSEDLELLADEDCRRLYYSLLSAAGHEKAIAKVREYIEHRAVRRKAAAAKLDAEHAKLHPPKVVQKVDPVLTKVADPPQPEWPFDDWGTIHDKDEPEYAVFTTGRE